MVWGGGHVEHLLLGAWGPGPWASPRHKGLQNPVLSRTVGPCNCRHDNISNMTQRFFDCDDATALSSARVRNYFPSDKRAITQQG